MPILFFSLREPVWEIENVGRGPAMNIIIGDDAGNGKDFASVIEYYPIAVGRKVSLRDHIPRGMKLVVNYTDVWGTPYSITCSGNNNHPSRKEDRKLLEHALENARRNHKVIKPFQLKQNDL